MELTDRQMNILKAIINDYIVTAEPIGSRTIEKKYNLGVSSATIRNDMSDLEEKGLIEQLHTSSGRIPSDLGYRLYVNSILQFRDLTGDEKEFLHQVVAENISKIDYLMHESAKALAILTNYPAIVTEPSARRVTVKHIQLVPVDEDSFTMVLVTNEKIVKHFFVEMKNAPNHHELLIISNLLSEVLHGLAIEQIDEKAYDDLVREVPKYKDIYKPLIKIIRDTLLSEENIKLYTYGVNQLLAFPEFSEAQKAKEVFSALEEPETLLMLFKENKDQPFGVVIGGENDLAKLKNCSIIRANYGAGGHSLGSLGIIGPTRMQYGEVISVLKGIVKHIEIAIDQLKGR